ncbi:unnamed protein product [Aphanomyces euteiches]
MTTASNKGGGLDYTDATTPKSPLDALESGVAQPDGALVYNSREVKALVGQYIVIGLLYGVLPHFPLNVLNDYYDLSSSNYNAPTGLVLLFGWSLKAFVGLLSDVVPIMGYRRKSYMLGGWVCCAVVLLVLACLNHGSPSSDRYYRQDSKDIPVDPDFQAKGTRLGFLCALATFCYAFADVPADALVVEYAHREPDEIRGRLKRSCTRWDMGLNVWFFFLFAAVLFAIPVTFFYVKEAKKEAATVSSYVAQFRALLQTRGMWQLMAFNFIFSLLANSFPSVAPRYVQNLWGRVSSVDTMIMNVIGSAAFAATLAVVGKWGQTGNWRRWLVLTTLILNGVDAVCQFLSIYDILRNQIVFAIVPLAGEIPRAVQFILMMFTIVEVSDDGNQGLVFGVLTTCSTMAVPLGAALSHALGGVFRLNDTRGSQNYIHGDNQIAYTYIIHYGLVCVAVCLVSLFPTQRTMLREWKKASNDGSKSVGGWIFLAGAVLFVVAVIYNLMIVSDSVTCFRQAGGNGC